MFALDPRKLASTIVAMTLATLLVACGSDDGQAPGAPAGPAAPAIAAFTATPATLPAGGGPVTLTWTTSGATTLSIDNGVGDVSGTTSKTVTVARGTTFTLTATNAGGSVTASAAVAVAAVAAPTITAFAATPATLPPGGGSTTLSWTTTGATSLVIDNGVGDVSGATSKAVTVAANTTFTLTATNAAGVVTRATSVVIAAAADRYVDSVNGSDANPCTLAAPCRSIRVSLLGAPSGATLALADGIYSQGTEGSYSAVVPDGVTLRATHPGAVTLANISVTLRGSATLDGLVFGTGGAPDASACGSVSSGGGAAVVTLNVIGVFSNCPGWLNVYANAHVTMTPGALPGGVYTSGLPAGRHNWLYVFATGQLVIQGGVLEGNGTGVALEQAGVLDVAEGGSLTLDGVTIRDYAQAGIHTQGTTVLKNHTLIDHVGAAGDPGPLASTLSLCTTDSAIVLGDPAGSVFSMADSTLSNAPSAGICVASNFGFAPQSLNITHSTITGSGGAAIESDFNLDNSYPVRPPVTIVGSALTNNGRAIFWFRGTGTVFDISDTTITGSTGAANTGGSGTDTCLGAAVHFDVQNNPGSIKLRGSTISGNAAEGVCLANFSGLLTADLGTSADPGNNVLTGNGSAGVRLVNSSTTTVNAVGNLWTPNQQGADAAGRYSVPPAFVAVPKTGPASGANYRIDYNVSTLDL